MRSEDVISGKQGNSQGGPPFIGEEACPKSAEILRKCTWEKCPQRTGLKTGPDLVRVRRVDRPHFWLLFALQKSILGHFRRRALRACTSEHTGPQSFSTERLGPTPDVRGADRPSGDREPLCPWFGQAFGAKTASQCPWDRTGLLTYKRGPSQGQEQACDRD